MGSADIVAWVMSCYHPDSGGFGGNVGHDAHMLYVPIYIYNIIYMSAFQVCVSRTVTLTPLLPL